MRATGLFLIAAAVSGLAACQTTARDEYGTSPLSMTTGLQDAFNEYLKTGEPKYFAVSEDGRAYGYSSCHSTRCTTERDFFLARDECLRLSQGVPCKIYARGTAVVWASDAIERTGMRRTTHMPDEGLQRPGRRWNSGRIVD